MPLTVQDHLYRSSSFSVYQPWEIDAVQQVTALVVLPKKSSLCEHFLSHTDLPVQITLDTLDPIISIVTDTDLLSNTLPIGLSIALTFLFQPVPLPVIMSPHYNVYVY